jgi:hypothetical protein
MLASSAPPPVSTMPLSTMSAASSGGWLQRDLHRLDDLRSTGSAGLGDLALGDDQFLRHAVHQVAALDLDRAAFAVSGGQAEPISFLMRSAELSPISRL